jgi:uncharacterized heparinase superfamily protein
VRYHRPSQFARRGVTQARRWLLRRTRGGRYARSLLAPPSRRNTNQFQSVLERRLSNRRLQSAPDKARAILAGRFCFLNQDLRLPDPVDWRLADREDVDSLWRFHLHDHEYLLDLAAYADDSGFTRPIERAWDLVRQWIDANDLSDPRSHDDAWHPFCISRRLPVWILLWQFKSPPNDCAAVVAESMYRQARFLASHLERDLGGNHLLENARALVFAGAFFAGSEPDRWLQTGGEVLTRELPHQIMTHGEHFERSPMYHALVLDALLDIRDAVRDLEPDLARLCDASSYRMAEFLERILHPDGEIPLLGDSALGEAGPPRELIRQSRIGMPGRDGSSDPSSATNTRGRLCGDYWVWRAGTDYLLLDAGPVGPDHLPAHAHSDLSTFELSLAGRRFIVDSGTFAYRDDEMRRYCRSTAAHNVLQIDGLEQCDTWSRFRMGFRGHPLDLESGESEDFAWARMRHDAYRRAQVAETGRWIACRANGPWIVVDWAAGRGRHQLVNQLHLHPDVVVERIDDNELRCRLDSDELRLGSLSPGQIEVVEGPYCPSFGRRINGYVVRWTTDTNLPAVCGWWLVREGQPRAAPLELRDPEGHRLTWSATGARFEWICDLRLGPDNRRIAGHSAD